MIKFSTMKFPLHFSTIRYPQYTVKAFNLKKDIRTCLSLSDMHNYIKEHDQQIKTYGKTVILERLHEFPVNFIYRSKDSNLKVYCYALELSDLNIYEEQMKQAALIKYKEYLSCEYDQWQNVIDNHEKQVELRIEKTPFDIADAFNWIFIKRSLKCNKLFFHAIDIISQVTKEDEASLYSRRLALVIRRIEQLEWSSLRECKKLLKFVCYDYKLSKESLKEIASIISRISELKLHAVGYTQVPSALDDAIATIVNNSSKISYQSLLMVFGSYTHFPFYYNQIIYNELFALIRQRILKEPIYLQMLPLNRMTEKEVHIILQAIFSRDYNLFNFVYFMNTINSKLLLRSAYFVGKLEEIFFSFLHKKYEILRSNHQAVICVARVLAQHHSLNPQKLEQIHTTLKDIHKYYLTEMKEYEMTNMASLQNQLSYVHFNIEINLMKDQKRFQKSLEENIEKFALRKYDSWKLKKHFCQIVESLAIFANTKHKMILTYIDKLIRKEIDVQEDLNTACVMEYIFYLQKFKRHEFFEDTINYFYDKLENKKLLALAQIYVSRVDSKSARVTEELIVKLYQKSQEFVPIGKIIAGVAPTNLTDHQFFFNNRISSILNKINFNENTQMMEEFSLIQITNILNLCFDFSFDIRKFSITFLNYLSATIVKNYKELSKNTSFEDQMCFFKAIRRLKTYFKAAYHPHFFTQLKLVEQQIKQYPNMQDMIKIHQISNQVFKQQTNKKEQSSYLQTQVQKIVLNNMNNLEKSGLLIKLHLLLHFQINDCPSCKQYQANLIKDIQLGFTSYQLNLNHLRIVLNKNYIKIIAKEKRVLQKSNIRDLIEYAFQMDVKHDRTTYLYFLRLGHLLQLNQVVEICVKELTCLDLEPYQFMEVLRIAEERKIKLDNKVFQSLDNRQSFELMYALSTRNINLEPYLTENSIMRHNFQEFEGNLLKEVCQIIKQSKYEPIDKKELHKKLFKYYYIAILNNLTSKNTFLIFNKIHMKFFSQLKTYLKNSEQKEDYYMILYLLQRYDKNHPSPNVLIDVKKTYIQPRKSFFSAKPKKQTKQLVKTKTLKAQVLEQFSFMKQSLYKSLPLQKRNVSFENLLISQGIHPKTSQNSKEPYFEKQYTCNNITLPIYIQDFEKRYGIIYYYNHNTQKKKPVLIEKILSELLGFPVIAINIYNPEFRLPK